MPTMILERVAKLFPELEEKMIKAGMIESKEEFIKKTMVSAGYMTVFLLLFFLFVFAKLKGLVFIAVIATPMVFVFTFLYIIKLPDVKILRLEKEVNKEIIFAGRFLIIELESGVPLYNAMKNLSLSYPNVGRYIKEITDKVDMGTAMEEALSEATEIIPSKNLSRLLWQVLNSIKTGADIGDALNAILDQVAKEQQIEVSEYGKKLNPLAMFYMMIAVILPSLGITMLMILATFIGVEVSLLLLMIMALGLAFVQFMFVNIIKSQRPAVEL